MSKVLIRALELSLTEWYCEGNGSVLQVKRSLGHLASNFAAYQLQVPLLEAQLHAYAGAVFADCPGNLHQEHVLAAILGSLIPLDGHPFERNLHTWPQLQIHYFSRRCCSLGNGYPKIVRDRAWFPAYS